MEVGVSVLLDDDVRGMRQSNGLQIAERGH